MWWSYDKGGVFFAVSIVHVATICFTQRPDSTIICEYNYPISGYFVQICFAFCTSIYYVNADVRTLSRLTYNLMQNCELPSCTSAYQLDVQCPAIRKSMFQVGTEIYRSIWSQFVIWQLLPAQIFTVPYIHPHIWTTALCRTVESVAS